MIISYSQGTSISVLRLENHLRVQVNNLSTTREDLLQLETSLPGLEITSSYLETAWNSDKTKVNTGVNTEIKEITGMEIGFQAFEQVKETQLPVPSEQSSYYRKMILEALIAVMQSECFFVLERGFDSLEHYDQFWNQAYKDNCRYYSNLHRVKQSFSHYISNQHRKRCLFSRQKNAHLEKASDNIWMVTSSLRDSFHEMHLQCRVDPAHLNVLEARGKMNRGLDDVCFETESKLPFLNGTMLSLSNRKEIRSISGGPDGCAHFADLAVDAAFIISEASEKQFFTWK